MRCFRLAWVFGLVAVLSMIAFSDVIASNDESAKENANEIYDPALYKGLKYRSIGPFRGGRSTAVTGVEKQPHTYYMGTTGGGVWKTTDAGLSWQNISDGFFNTASIGAIEVAANDPNVIYVGTGSACPRGNVSVGDGVYKSTDAGKTWHHAGLKEGGQIGRIRIHPSDSDLVYAAVLGNVFGAGPERGVFRSSDGGKNWQKVLFISDRTGAVDLSMDVHNPRIIYAATWQFDRKPWTIIDGSEDSGIYRTTNGGDTWERLKGGLPEGLAGRAGVAVSAANPNRIWVLQEAEEGGVFRSDDGGKSWKRVNKNRDLRTRAWYYTHIFADPNDPDTVFVLNAGFFKSIDGGKSFERIRTPHGDNHDLWINPDNSEWMVTANDGGGSASINGGKTWETQHNQPTAEFYRVTLDQQFPYRVYGAQQDNSTISVPSIYPGGISPTQHWYSVGGGESGHIAVDPRNPDIIYAGNYIGQITRMDRQSGHSREIVAYPQMHDGVAPRDIRYRFQWNAPIRLSPHDPDVLYHTSQFVHRSDDQGQSWQVISPDLTTNNDDYHDLPGGPIQHDHTGVELYTTIFAFEESSHQAGLLWAGSDDGLVHISRDGGGGWKNITPSQMPKDGTVNMIELSADDPGRALIAVYGYRRNDFRPYIFRTNNYGGSWDLLTDGKNGIPDDHFVRVVREDPNRRGLLYAGTEFGMYMSFDDGSHWQSLQLNLPVTPITDMAVFRNDLVVATQGRSFWILDDLTPLQQLNGEVAESKAFLFQPRSAYRTRIGRSRRSGGPQNPPPGAVFYYQFAEKPESEVTMEILDSGGKVIRSYSSAKEQKDSRRDGRKLPAAKGMQMFNWDLTLAAPDLVEGAVMSLSYTGGPTVPTGKYQVRLSSDDWTQTREFEVHKDPRWAASDDDLQAQFDLTLEVLSKLNETHEAIGQIRSIREQAKTISQRAVKAGYPEEIKKAATTLADRLTAIEEDLIQTKNEVGQDPINFPPQLDDQFAYLYTVVNFQDARPTEGSYQRFEDLKSELAVHLEALSKVTEKELAEFQALLEKEKVGRIILPLAK